MSSVRLAKGARFDRELERAGRQLARTLSQNVQAGRERQGWTQEELGLAAGLDRTYVNQVESRKIQNPEMKSLLKLSLALGISVPELLTDRRFKRKGVQRSKGKL